MYHEDIAEFPEEPLEAEYIESYSSQQDGYEAYGSDPQYAPSHDGREQYDDYEDPTQMHPQKQRPARAQGYSYHPDDERAAPFQHDRDVPDRIRLRPVSELPDVYRTMFKFGVFNAVQSTCIDPVMTTDENMVISGLCCLNAALLAPTGSGKTVLFELAIIKMLNDMRSNGSSLKCVYMAPTKALCSERQRDWSAKFDPLGIKCCELTGDTVLFGKGAWGDAKHATIMYGEKWDSLTRNWSEHGQVLSQIQLFLVDEVHILNESRGSTLEVVISRMKTRGTSVRFVMVSATVPNIQDIANWVGSARNREQPAKVYEFGEEYRPCKLTRHVVSVPRQKNSNDFQFAKILDYKLFETLQLYSSGKPILVFVATRKGVFGTAEQLKKDYDEAMKKKQTLPWSKPPRSNYAFNDKRLEELALYGIGVHHAGLGMDDRRATEELYLNRKLRIVIATSTLAVGVNLPAHTVVIKGVHMFQNNMSMEYSDLDIVQMLGRAGRPQFDKEGVAIILCEDQLEAKYRALVQGRTILESSLHLNLSEHLNSEIGLGTITNLDSAKGWLRNSFLFQRIQRNPNHYALGKSEEQTWEERMDDLVIQSIVKLKESELVSYEGEAPAIGRLQSTEYGDIMSKFYIRQTTMCLILAMPEKPTLREVLLGKINRHNDLRFTIKKVEKTADKAFLLIQAILGGLPLNSPEFKSADSQPQLEAFSIFKHIGRIAKAVVEVAIARQRGAQLKYGLELSRCFNAKAWEDRPIVLRQIAKIGEKSYVPYSDFQNVTNFVLAEHGVTTVPKLRMQNPIRIEALLNRRPPFGHEVLAFVHEMPQYSLNIKELQVHPGGGDRAAAVEVLVECGVIEPPQSGSSNKKTKLKGGTFTSVLTMTSDDDFVDFRRIPTKSIGSCKSFEVTAELTKPSQSVVVYISSDQMVEDLEANPDFWDMMDDEAPTSDEKPIPQSVPTKQYSGKTNENKPPPAPKAAKARPRAPALPADAAFEERCRHLWYVFSSIQRRPGSLQCLSCRDGLPAPPLGLRKKPSTGNADPKSPAPTQAKVYKKKTPVKKSPAKPRAKPDRRLHDLDELHRNAKVSENLGIGNGKRIKIDTTPLKLSSPQKTNPEHGGRSPLLEFKELEDDDDDDLPDPLDILRTMPSKQESSDDYSDSELDALMLKIPSDEIPSSSAPPVRGSSSKKRLSTPISRNNVKRAKVEGSSSSPGPHRNKVGVEPLFLDIPSSEEDEPIIVDPAPASKKRPNCSPTPSPTADARTHAHTAQDPAGAPYNDSSATYEDAVTYDDATAYDDSGYFESLAMPPSPVSFCDVDKPMDESSLTTASNGLSPPLSWKLEKEALAMQVDEMDEFDAWLNSGAVEIV
ncbi:P-loop containing nucleoside triphosphate hydrolase protein [Schizophyllum commune]